MPLIMMCGIPCSGKTSRAKELYEYLKEKNQKVVLINEESLLIKRSEGYQGIISIFKIVILSNGLNIFVRF